MQTIAPLTNEDFHKSSAIIAEKIEVDTNGEGNFQELPDVKTFNVQTNEENRVARFSSYSFNISCLNTNKRYNQYNYSSLHRNWLKQGRRIKIWLGIKKDGNYYFYQRILGRIDTIKMSTKAGSELCTITGRCQMRLLIDYKLTGSEIWWGTSHVYSTESGKTRYNMEANCNGVYRAFLDSTPPYNGSNLEEIYENQDWTYDWHNNQLVFAAGRFPEFDGTNNLVVYYLTTQTVEDVVADILLAAKVFSNETERNNWVASANCELTGKTIDRVWFNSGTSASRAITLLAEVVQYNFYFDYEGVPKFLSVNNSSTGTVATLTDYQEKVLDINKDNSEIYNHIIVKGETRLRIPEADEVPPETPVNLALTTGMGEPTQAPVTWIKATWDANTEFDFGHYELRIRKDGDADWTEVSTVAISYMFYGLEPGVTYYVQIRAVDIYENRSDWSSAESITTPTDSTAPSQVTGVTVGQLLAGIQVEWSPNTEHNLGGYKIERQESPDNVDWTGAWTEIGRIIATFYVDLLLSYSKYYRYRITAYNQAGVFGAVSLVSDALQPRQAGTNDIVANAITADLIAADAVLANNIKAGEIDTDHLAAGAITAAKIEADAVTSDKIDVSSLSAVSATLGSVSSGTISSSQIRFTTSTSYSAYFTSSGIYVYDGYSAHGAPSVTFYKSGLKRFGILLGSAGSGIYSETKLVLNGGSTSVTISGGVLALPNLISNPTGQYGGICMVGGQLKYYDGSSWVNA
jgi:hypothetical protein